MNTVEDRLREALHRRAERSPAMELPAAMERIRHRVRRQRRRQATGSVVAVVAAAAAAALAVPAMNHFSGAGPRDPALNRSTARPQMVIDIETSAPYQAMLKKYPPKGPITVVDLVPGGHGSRIKVWVSAEDGKPAFCRSKRIGNGGGSWGCGTGVLSALSQSRRGVIKDGVERTETGGEVVYGVADDRVASVSATLSNGGELPGRLVRLNDSAQFWYAGAPQAGTVKEYVFKDKAGNVVWHYPWGSKQALTRTFCSSPLRRPAAEAVDLFGSGRIRLSATFKAGCVSFWQGGDKAGVVSLDPPRAPGKAWFRMASDRWWYGMADPATAKVELRFPDGDNAMARLIRPPWPGANVVLFAGDNPKAKQLLRDGRLVGYGADGKVLWRG